MPRSRGHGEGTIRRRKSGRWEARLPMGTENGRRVERYFAGASYREVLKKLAEARAEKARGRLGQSKSLPLATFLGGWLDGVVRHRRRTTQKGYETYCRLHLIPGLGRVSLEKLDPGRIQIFCNAKLDAGFDIQTVHHMRAVLRTALTYALRHGLVTYNAAALVELPPIPDRHYRVLDVQEAGRLLEAIRGDRLEAAYLVGLSVGLRMSEVVGLRWENVDFDNEVIWVRTSIKRIRRQHVEDPVKTHRSRRPEPLIPFVADALGEHKQRQLAEKHTAGPPWQGLVFTDHRGQPLHGTNILRAFQTCLARAAMPRMKFHELRHSLASMLFALGVDPKTVQEILGHSRLSTTMDLYTHLDPTSLPAPVRDAASAMERIFRRRPPAFGQHVKGEPRRIDPQPGA